METTKTILSKLFRIYLLGIFTLTAAGMAQAGPSKFFVDITDPDSYVGVYQHAADSSLDRLYIEYNKWTDTFSVRYDFTGSADTRLGDAYFKFSNNGQTPDGNGGTSQIPIYRFDSQTQKLRILTDFDVYETDGEYGYDEATRKGYVSFHHSVAEVAAIFPAATDPSINWSGGSFTTDLGIWSHVVNVDFFNVDPVTGEFILTEPFLTENWIAFDPDPGQITTQSVPEPSSIMLVLLGLFGCFYRQIFLGLGSLFQSNNRQYQAG